MLYEWVRRLGLGERFLVDMREVEVVYAEDDGGKTVRRRGEGVGEGFDLPLSQPGSSRLRAQSRG